MLRCSWLPSTRTHYLVDPCKSGRQSHLLAVRSRPLARDSFNFAERNNPMKISTSSIKSSLIAALLGVAVFAVACGGGGSRGGGGGDDDLSPAECQSGQITVWGEAPIFTSVETSRQKAKENACRKAVEKCIGEEVAKQSGVSDGQSIANETFSQSKGICKNDSIVSENKYKIDTIEMLKVTVRFTVSEVDVRNAIDVTKKLAGNPKVMVLIREEHNIKGAGKTVYGFTDPKGKASAGLRQVLNAKGYTIVPADRIVDQTIGRSEEALAQDPMGEAAKETFNTLKDRVAKAGVDVVIIGEIETEHQDMAVMNKYTKDFKSYNSKGNVRVITMWGKGEELLNYSAPERAADVTHAAASQAAAFKYAVGAQPEDKASKYTANPKKLARAVTEVLQNKWAEVTRSNKILMKVSKMDPKTAGLFIDDLKERTGVKEIVQQSTSGENHEWEVTYPGRSFALADTLVYYGDNPTKFNVVAKTCRKITVTEVKRGEISVELTPVPSDQKFRCVPPS